MPCWFYDKKDLLNTPSAKDGISAETEAWYRKEGAKNIMDAGNKLGLRFDTCATGVVYFHRFYMFHSFKEFHQLVTSACCLFLAGKVEETPKKCKDIIKTFRSMLNDSQFAHFGEDPKEEVMTLERILLQTIKFDLMVEHPYAFLLKFAKLVKGDKAKIQKMVQMAWTFINDSLCTTLCLQWEPEIVAVAVMYLTSRLNKFDIVDWQGKPLGYRGKWYEFLVEDVTLELLEDICHQVLDLYSNAPQPQKDVVSSPAPVKPRQLPLSSDDDQSRTPRTPKSPHGIKRPAPSSAPAGAVAVAPLSAVSQPPPVDTDVLPPPAKDRDRSTAARPEMQSSSSSSSRPAAPAQPTVPVVPAYPAVAPTIPIVAPAGASTVVATTSSTFNPYMSTQMYSSSFMSTEGSQSIQSLIGTQPPPTRDDLAAAQGRPPGYAPGSMPPAYQTQQYAVGSQPPVQQYATGASNQGSLSVGAAVPSQRQEYAGGPAAAAGSYRNSGSYQGGGVASASSSSYGPQLQQQQAQYPSYQQPPPSQQTSTESYGQQSYMASASQSQYVAGAQSTSPVYQNYGGSRNSGAQNYGMPPPGGPQQQQQQQQRYQVGQPSANPTYQTQSAPGAGYQSQPESSTSAGYQGQPIGGVGGYQGRSASSAGGYPSQLPAAATAGYHQSSQQGYGSSGRESASGSGYQPQPGYQQPPLAGGGRSAGGQHQGNAPGRGQNWGY